MLSRRAFPRWQSKRAASIVNNPRRVNTAQFHIYGPRSSLGSNPTPDPIEVLHAQAQSTQAPVVRQISFLRRFFRGALYVGLFSATGFVAAWGWKTWTYLRTGQTISEPTTRRKHKEWFSSKIESSSLVQSLKEDGWIEEDPMDKESLLEDSVRRRASRVRGQHMVNERLVNDGYLATKHFRHPTDGMTVLVFMADFGCESWPSTLHGGIATTVIQEALDTHLKTFPEYAPVRNRETTMNYRLPLNPGKMYSVLVRTDGTEYPYQTATEPDKSFMGVAVEVLLNEMTRAPRYKEKYNEETKITQRICDIRDAQKGVTAYVKGGSILFLASKDFREILQKDPQMIPALREKRDAWIRGYESKKAKPKQ